MESPSPEPRIGRLTITAVRRRLEAGEPPTDVAALAGVSRAELIARVRWTKLREMPALPFSAGAHLRLSARVRSADVTVVAQRAQIPLKRLRWFAERRAGLTDDECARLHQVLAHEPSVPPATPAVVIADRPSLETLLDQLPVDEVEALGIDAATARWIVEEIYDGQPLNATSHRTRQPFRVVRAIATRIGWQASWAPPEARRCGW